MPNSFVLKTTHSTGGGIVIVDNKNELDVQYAYKVLNKSLSENLYYRGYEWQYKDIKPQIIAEEYIKSTSELVDYKFFCFDGKPEYVYLSHTGKDGKLYLDFYDKDFKWVNVRLNGHLNYGERSMPEKFNEMKKIASILSANFAFVRVDLYCENGKIYFGELTFTPGNGVGKFEPIDFDYKLGELFDIKNLK